MRGDSFGPLVNTILGIAGAVVGGYLFQLLNLNPGAGIVKIISDSFGVDLPQNLVGTIITATVGSILIIGFFGLIKGKKGRN